MIQRLVTSLSLAALLGSLAPAGTAGTSARRHEPRVGATEAPGANPSRSDSIPRVTEVLDEFVAVYNLQAKPLLARFIREHYQGEALRSSPDAVEILTDRWLRAFSLVGPITVRLVEPSDAGLLRVWARGDLMRTWMAFTFGLDGAGKIDEHSIFSTWRTGHVAATGPPVPAADLAAYLEEYVEGLVAADAFSGIVALVDESGMYWRLAAGFPSDRATTRIDEHTPFDLASVSKIFVAVAALHLREQGRLSFDEPVSTYLPSYPRPVAERIDVGQLLSHTTGIRLQEDEEIYQKLFRAQSLSEQFELQTEAVAKRYGSDFRALGEYQYSNEGMDLVARIIEVVSGQSYFEYLGEHVLDPLGMVDTHSYRAAVDSEEVVVGLTRQEYPSARFVPGPRRGNHLFRYDVGRPAGGLVTTAQDLARFALALLEGRVLSEESWAAMMQPRAFQHETADFRLHYGWGMDVYEYGRSVVVGHGGGRPGCSTRLDAYPDLGVALIVLSNYDYVAHRIAEHVQEALMIGTFETP